MIESRPDQIELIQWAVDSITRIKNGQLEETIPEIVLPPELSIPSYKFELYEMESYFGLKNYHGKYIQKEPFNFSDLSKEDLWNVSFTCDVVSRIMMCQFDRITDVVEPFNMGDDFEVLHAFRNQLDDLKRFWGLNKNAYFGIFSKEVDDRARTLWDIHQVIRNRLAYDNNPGITPENRWERGKITVDFDEPMHSNPNIPLIKVIRIDA